MPNDKKKHDKKNKKTVVKARAHRKEVKQGEKDGGKKEEQ